ncbi:MAG TPA: PfaD family polyunsaturated fatty acid/polyketide biosynthesis protein [Thermoanaerobaculia bacterium]|nr:PfaD family polyunsaturated fatty acid/polyketide biosynthesis protein [Thermoanaerobaculia bacterium]
MTTPDLTPLGTWTPGPHPAAFAPAELLPLVPRVREAVHVVRDGARGRVGLGLAGATGNGAANGRPTFPWLATLPPLFPEWLGDRSFLDVHRVRFSYVAGEMANGIATSQMVVAMARAGMLGFFGAAGLSPARVEKALDEVAAGVGESGASWGSNLIHSPNEPDLEEAIVDLYLRRRVQRVSASAYMDLTPAVVRYAASGLALDPAGRVRRRNHVFAKLSRPEVARRFLSPPPAAMLQALVAAGKLSAEEARLAAHLPLAEDVTVEADSGGHTDNQSLTALFPTILQLRDRLAAQHGYTRPIRVGAAGGLGTPSAVAAAFALGAAYVLTGSVNQAAVESGLSEAGKRMLAQAELTDVVMAPAADMFELGIKVQVLRRGTLFGVRAARLYELYRGYDSLEALPADVRQRLEKEIFRAPLEQVWEETRQFFARRDPRENERAERDPRHRMALVFRWYLGRSSGWAVAGDGERQTDYQVWCGPAMGAFNSWVAGSFLERLADRTVVQIARNLLEGAAVVTRAQQLRSYGVAVPGAAFHFSPRPLS